VVVPAGAVVDTLVGLAGFKQASASLVFDLPNHLSGARYSVPAGRRLCACGAPNFVFNEPWRASWAGFVPYQ